jgi:hypothetical protein
MRLQIKYRILTHIKHIREKAILFVEIKKAKRKFFYKASTKLPKNLEMMNSAKPKMSSLMIVLHANNGKHPGAVAFGRKIL